MEIILSKLFAFFKRFLAFLNIFKTPFEVEPLEPWKELINNFGKVLNKGLSDESPFIALNTSWTLNDLLQPGLPTINKGTLALTQANIVNKFSKSALFFAIPFFISIFFAIYCCSCSGISMKLSPKIEFIFKAKSFRNSLFDKRI